MSDPAIEAAQRAWTERYGPEMTSKYFDPSDDVDDVAAFVTAAAREALKPIRQKIHYTGKRRDGSECCAECRDEHGRPKDWPCRTAQYLYLTEELNQ